MCVSHQETNRKNEIGVKKKKKKKKVGREKKERCPNYLLILRATDNLGIIKLQLEDTMRMLSHHIGQHFARLPVPDLERLIVSSTDDTFARELQRPH